MSVPNASARPEKPSSASSGRRPRLLVLDGLRFIAAAMVVFFHYVGYGGGPYRTPWGHPTVQIFPTASWFAEYGWTGVELFFLISGFVICMSSWGRTLGEFFVSRVVRLYPAYWAGVLVTTLVLRLWPTVRNGQTVTHALLNLTLLQEPFNVNDVDAVYWSLWSEMRFYLLFALVIWRGVTYRRAVTFCVVWTIAAAVDASAHNALLDTWAQPSYSAFFIAGIAMYLMYRFGPNLLLWGIIGISWLVALNQIAVMNHAHALEMNLNLPNWGAQLLITAYFAVMIGVALGWFSWVRWRRLTAVGALTYPLYLVHEDVGWTMIHALRHAMPSYLNLLLTTLAMLALAWLIHRAVEKPLAKRLKRALTDGLGQLRDNSIPRPRTPADRQVLPVPAQTPPPLEPVEATAPLTTSG